MASIVKVPVADFSPERLDTGFYSADFFNAKASIQASGFKTEPIGDVCEPWQFGAYALCNDIVWSDKSNGVPFIKAESIESPLINEGNLSYISESTHELLSKSSLEHGDIIVSTSGSVGYLAVVPESIPVANSNQDTIKFCLEGTNYDSHYVVAWLTSRFAQVFMKREAGGAIQQHIYLFNFKRIPLLKINAVAQKYIGDKVRQAERLREWAKGIEQDILHFHQTLIPNQSNLNFDKRIRRVSGFRMAERLDAHFYPSVVEEYLKAKDVTFKSLKNICVSIFNGQTQPEISHENPCEQISVANLSSSFVVNEPRKVLHPIKRSKFLKKHDILMCNAAHSKSYIGRELTYFHSDKAILPSTEVMTIRVDRNKIPASYVRNYFLTKLGYVQIQSTIRGITAHSYPDDVGLLEIPIPIIPDHQHEQWCSCDEQMVKAGIACETATYLTSAAKLLVEALIEGQITEPQLIKAQQALEKGDTNLDQSILKRLKTDGMDGEDQPLFPDLDQLYKLLEQAEDINND